MARVESRTETQEFRIGRMGNSEFAGPMGLHIAYVKERFHKDATDLIVNVQIGVKALRGKNKIHVLKRYNPEWTRAYINEVMKVYRQLRRKKCQSNPGPNN